MSDGYNPVLIEKFVDMQNLFEKQIKINTELSSIAKEIEGLPEIPDNIDRWLDSVQKITQDKSFTLSDFKKMFKINKEYNKLIEDRDENAHKIRVAVIDDLLLKIQDLLDKK